MSEQYEVVWCNGRERMAFTCKQAALRYLNHLILVCKIGDAKLKQAR